MRISDRYHSTIERVAEAKPAAAATKAAKAGAAEGSSKILDVKMSPEAKELSSTSAARVEQLKNQIKNGTFKVDADAIAAKLVGGGDE